MKGKHIYNELVKKFREEHCYKKDQVDENMSDLINVFDGQDRMTVIDSIAFFIAHLLIQDEKIGLIEFSDIEVRLNFIFATLEVHAKALIQQKKKEKNEC